MANQYLTMKELKEALPEIPENSLKRYLQEHAEYINFKKEHNRYKIQASEIEKLKLIRKLYSDGLKKEEVTTKLEEAGFPVTITVEDEEESSSTSLMNVNHELTDMKKLVSFLVQQNEQSRLQQNKIREQNKQLIHEVQELKQTIDDLRHAQEQGNEQESEKVTSLYEKLMLTQKSVEEVASAVEAEKSKTIWQKLFGK
ncbi:hypothetical protein J7I93_10585 [Bacillus sp. ISL-47]|uniref:hypothetical protein n=1 Tax=Bacillus sp. ISL-47 TaxID=2819130 RepID=UPI001BE82EFB|nr:hypothetical protein [Bacillus sp. ISL-47]MBT2688632.1 hypothetical protein [Bacillus sp. ISL-47]MBT2710618.1 hypothetical protein [Pseudomonas sp. ISL-84]